MTPAELIEEFELFDTWEDRYRYIIELGSGIADLPAEHKVEANRVQGCQSNVWLVAEALQGPPPRLDIRADSDSQIVRGLIAILLILYAEKTPQEIIDLDVEEVFAKVELRRHLSRSRSNGLHSMVQRIVDLAREAA